MKREFVVYNNSPLGEIFVVSEKEGSLSAVYIGNEDFNKNENPALISRNNDNYILQEALKQLEEYFSGALKDFTLPLIIQGTEFQSSVWKELLRIPYGTTKSYLDVASSIGKPKAVRAIGQANKANKLPIIIPCHRVIGSNQKLVGYAGNKTGIKEQLLQLEGATFKIN